MAGFITQESIDEVAARTDIIQVISEYVPLTQRGTDFSGCCPFHHEKTPSFHVSADKKLYHCFGCGVGGTVFNFVMEMEKINFPAAIELLAKKAGVQLHYSESGSPAVKEDPDAKLKEEIVSLYNRTANLFNYMLTQTEAGKFALDYIMKRGISKETVEKFKLGYSPADRKFLHRFLVKKNFSPEFLAKTALFSEKSPEIAIFSDRLMFPIFDRKGDVVALGGRFLRGNPERSAKYMNSPDSIQYKKGRILYAFNFAKQSIRENKRVIFCEGYMDCIAYHQCGIQYAVAPLGTALTEEQITIVKPFVECIYLSFDSDGAGQKATWRAILMCRRAGLSVRVINLSGGKDPAEIMLKYGPDSLTNVINDAILDNDYLLTKLREMYPKDSPEGKAKACLEFFSYLDVLQSDVQKEACLENLCQAYEIDLEAARKDYSNRERLARNIKRNTGTTQNAPEKPKQGKIHLTAELRAVITVVSNDADYFKKMSQEISVEDLTDPQAKSLFIIMDECSKNETFSVSNILNRCESEELKRLIIQSMDEYSSNVGKAVSDSILLIKRNVLERKGQVILQEMRRLEKSPVPEDRENVTKLLQQKMDIDKQIALIKG
jgi:DNA primase